jgi:hypothetical protein
MSKSPDSARQHCDRASEGLQRAAALLEQSAAIRESVARVRVSSIPPVKQIPSVILIREANGVLRVKKD